MIDGALTELELEILRRDGQASKHYLAFLTMPIVFQARVNQTFTSNDKIAQVTYDDVTLGLYTDILPGMTLWIGSSAGAYDLGRLRIRKTPTSSLLYFGETSEIEWVNDLYLTVIREFDIWMRRPYTDENGVVFMDRDVAFSDQHTDMQPFPCFGSDRVVRLVDATVNVEFDASRSHCPGSSISDYLFEAPGASASIDMDTDTPTITYDAPGLYTVSCTVTAANGKTATGYRVIYIWDADHLPVKDFQFDQVPHGSYQSGGWECSLRMFDQAALDQVRERAKVLIFARDFYGGQEISIGPLPGSENIVMPGWIDGESIERDPRNGSVAFTVRGPQYWIGTQTGPTLSITNTAAAPASWSEMQGLTVDKALAHYLTWRTTLPVMMDCFLPGDTSTRYAPAFDAALGSMWDQLNLIAARILASACCDRYGRLVIQIESQNLPIDERSSIPTVMEITKADRRSMALNRQPVSSTSQLQISSLVMAAPGDTVATVYSMSGHIPRRFGRSEPPQDGFLAGSQSQSNEMCSLMMGRKNNPYPDIPINLGANNRAIDICPRQYITAPVSAGDSPRGIAFTDRIVPFEISLERGPGGVLLPVIHGEAESQPALAIDGDIPNSPALPSSPPSPSLPTIPDLDITPSFPVPTEPVIITPAVYLLFLGDGIFYTETFDDENPQWLAKNNGAPDDLGELKWMEIDKKAGILYTGGNRGLWYGNLGDANLTQFVDQDWLNTEFGFVSDSNLIGAIGVNQLIANALIVSCGSGYLGSRTAYLYLGSYSGLTRKAPISWVANDGLDGNLSVGGDVWLATQNGFIARNYWALYSRDAETVIEAHSSTPGYIGGFWHTRAGASAIVYTGDGSSNLYYSPDNLATMTARDFRCHQNLWGTVLPACSVNGQFMMAKRQDAGVERSTDFGATWGTMPAFPAGIVPTAIACIDADRWIVVGYDIIPYPPVVYYTDDFGETWQDKTGDLQTYVPVSHSGMRKVMVV